MAPPVEAGRAVLKLLMDDKELNKSFAKVQRNLRNTGRSIRSAGLAIGGIGAAITAPFALATKQFIKTSEACAGCLAHLFYRIGGPIVLSGCETGLSSVWGLSFRRSISGAHRKRHLLMATISVCPGTIPKTQRLLERDRYGDLESMYQQAINERQAGRLWNAKIAFHSLLAEWLRQEWIKKSGKVETVVVDPIALKKKLQSGGTIDGWTAKLVQDALCTPAAVRWVHVDMLAGVVSALCFGEVTANTSTRDPRLVEDCVFLNETGGA